MGRWKPSTKTHIAELFASKCTNLLGAAIDAHGVGVTLSRYRFGTRYTEGIPIMHFALNRRNPGITEVVGKSSRRAKNS